MKIKNYFLSVAAMLLIVGAGTAQTDQERQRITKNYDKQELRSLSESYSKIYNKQRQQALDYAKANDLPLVVENEKGEKSYLMRMDEFGNLIYYKSYSIDGAITIGAYKLWEQGGLGLQIEGENMLGGLWDGGIVRETHELLEGKVTLGNSYSLYDNHPTHIAGIMIGKRFNSGTPGFQARGIANKGEVISYDWNNDLAEMIGEASEGLLVSNHSYGPDLGQFPNPGDFAGRYDDVSRRVDNLTYNVPNYTIVTAAGNDRGYGNPNPDDNGYNLLGGQMATSKNTIVVAAVESVLDYNGPNSVNMASFSSWGPTNDNRVKPDISADGVLVYSSYAFNLSNGNPSDYAYATVSGTSMSAPSVAGSVMLIQELSADLTGEYLPSSMIRALMIGTARSADSQPGPNPRYGWGLLAVDKIAELMLDAYNNEGNSFYKQLRLDSDNPVYSKEIVADGDELKATIVWTDYGGQTQNIGDDSPRLVNDLDLRIIDSEGNIHYPWRLNPDGYDLPALNDGDNDVDNVEQVTISDPIPGETYTIEVTHKDNLRAGKQDFAIVAMGSETLSVKNHILSGFTVYPNPATNQVNLELEKTGEQVDVEVFDINGRRVLNTNYTGNANFNERLDISKLNNGVYFIKVMTDGKIATEKLIIK